MPKTVDSLEDLTPDLLNKIAVSLPIEDIGSFCSLSKSMSDLCKRESFWAERTMKDFPDYPPPQPLPPTITYREYYRGLWKALHLKDKRGGPIFFSISTPRKKPVSLSLSLSDVLLVYPVPRFELDDKNLIKPDVDIDFLSKDIIVVSIKNRRLRTGEYIPDLMGDIPVLKQSELSYDDWSDFFTMTRGYRDFYDQVHLVSMSDYDKLFDRARKLKFKIVQPNEFFFPTVMDVDPKDPDLFFERIDYVRDKKASPLLGQQKVAPPRVPNTFPLSEQPSVESPPVPRNKIKKLFGFLSSTAD